MHGVGRKTLQVMELHGKQILGGSESAEGQQSFFGINPTNGETLEPGYFEATQAEIDVAYDLAHVAHQQLRGIDTSSRATFLRAIAEEIEKLGEPLLERASAETGLPMARLTMERGRTCNQLRMFADLVDEASWVEARIDHAQPDRAPIPKPDLRRLLVPLGPVAVFGASNFPLAFSVAGGDTASAFAAGCPVVVKAHPNHPGTSEWVGRAVTAAVERCGMPAGMFSLIHGASIVTGASMVEHPIAKAVGFTGSLAGGRALFDLAAARPEPIPVYAEMGSTNPIFLLPGAMAGDGAEQLATALSQSVMLGVGQFCTSPGIIVTGNDQQAATLIAAMREQLPAAAPGTMLHAGIRRNFDQGLARLQEVPGVATHRSADAPSTESDCLAHSALSCTDASTFLANPVMAEEVFGPATIVVQCNDASEMLQVAENVGGQLTASVHGTDDDFQEYGALLATLTDVAGRVVFNGLPTGVEVCPSMHHGGPYPASTDARTTSVGTASIQRFARPVCYQDMPENLLPDALKDANPGGLLRLVDGSWTREGATI
jgi:alpha-ketoglutaric semialdehyde dehydrogenase